MSKSTVVRMGKGRRMADAAITRQREAFLKDLDDMGDGDFALLTKSLGNYTFMARLADRREVQVKVLSKNKRKDKTAWQTGRVVVVAPGPQKNQYEALIPLDRATAQKLVKEFKMPLWMTTESLDPASESGVDCGFDFEEEAADDEDKPTSGTKVPSAKASKAASAVSRMLEDDGAVDQDEIDVDAI